MSNTSGAPFPRPHLHESGLAWTVEADLFSAEDGKSHFMRLKGECFHSARSVRALEVKLDEGSPRFARIVCNPYERGYRARWTTVLPVPGNRADVIRDSLPILELNVTLDDGSVQSLLHGWDRAHISVTDPYRCVRGGADSYPRFGLNRVAERRAFSPELYPALLSSAASGAGRVLQICIVTSDFCGPVKNGGVGTFYTALAEMLAHEGHRVTVLWTEGDFCQVDTVEKWMAHYAERGIEFVPLPPAVRFGHCSVRRRQSFDVYQWLKQRKFDVVHFHEMRGHGYDSALAKRQGLAFNGTSVCVGVHSPCRWHQDFDQRFMSQSDEIEVELLERGSVENADVVFCPSEYLLRWIHERDWALPERTFVFPYLLDKVGKADRWSLNDEVEELAFFGRLETRKGLGIFCGAIDRLKSSCSPGMRITFLGKTVDMNGILSDEFIRRHAEKWPFPVEIHSELSREEALEYLRRPGKLVVMPSLSDNTPFAVIECLSAEIPFLSTNVGGIGELIEPEDREAVLCSADAKALAAKIEETLERARFGSLPKARLRFGLDRVGKAWSFFHQEFGGASQSLGAARVREMPSSASIVILDEGSPEELAACRRSIEAQIGSEVREKVIVDWRHGDDEGSLPDAGTDRRMSRLASAVQGTSGQYLLVMSSRDRLQPAALRTLCTAASTTGKDCYVCPVEVVTANNGRGETVTSQILSIAPDLATAALDTGSGSRVIFLPRSRFRQAYIADQPRRGAFDFQRYVINALIDGQRFEVVPELLLVHRFSAAERKNAEGSQIEARVEPFRRKLPIWTADIVEFVRALEVRQSHGGRMPSWRQVWLPERFNSSALTIVRATEENAFLPLEPLQDVSLESRGKVLQLRSLSAAPKLFARGMEPPLHATLGIRCGIIAPEQTDFRVSYRYAGQEYSKSHRIGKGMNDIYLEITETPIDALVTIEFGGMPGLFLITHFEIRALPED